MHIDGYNLAALPDRRGGDAPRKGFVYFSDDGDVLALRFDNWKMVFLEQRCAGHAADLGRAVHVLRVPKMFNLRIDPFERADITSNTYWDWMLENDYLSWPADRHRGASSWQTFEEFPPRQKAASFTIDQVVDKLEAALTSGR